MSEVQPMWLHSAARGLDIAASEGMARALAEDWQSGPLDERVNALRGYLVQSTWTRSRLVGRVTRGEATAGLHLDPAPQPATEERRIVAETLARTPRLLAEGAGGFAGFRPPAILQTSENDAAGLPVVAVVAIAVASAAAVAYCAHQAAQVVDNYLAREDRARQVLHADAQALEVVERHIEREDAAGGPLPLDAASKAALAELANRQNKLVEAATPPVGSGAPPVSVATGFGFGAAVVAGLVVWGLWASR